MKTLNKQVARKVLEIVDAGLTNGLGEPKPGQMCVEAAICYALDLPHGDDPKCVADCIRRYKIRLNDSRWSSNKARAKGMRRAAIAQLGSEDIDQKKWHDYVFEQTIRRIVPEAFRAAARVHKDEVHAERLLEAALRCEREGTRESAINARDVGRAAAYAAARAAAYAADAAADAAYAAADAAYAAADAAAAAAKAKERDRILSIAAEICVEACVLCKTKGSKWLDITEAV